MNPRITDEIKRYSLSFSLIDETDEAKVKHIRKIVYNKCQHIDIENQFSTIWGIAVRLKFCPASKLGKNFDTI